MQSLVGVGAAVFLAVALFKVNQSWDRKEGTFLNVFLMLKGPTPVEPILGLSTSEQVAYLDKVAQDLEQEIPEFLVRSWFGEDIAAASFGPTQTVVAEILVPSHETDRKIPVLCTRPKSTEDQKPLPLVLYFYLGGLVFGSPKAELKQIRFMARETPAVVCAIQYRRAPEHPYPAATDDAFDASLFLIQNGPLKTNNPLLDALGVTIDPSKIATYGVSAGGYLAGQTSRRLAVAGISIQLQVSIVPMAKPLGGTNSLLKYGDFWNRAWNSYAWTVYLPGDDGTKANDWTVSLLVDPPGGEEVMDRLPPVYLELHQRDVLYDEGKLYAQRLMKQQKLLELVEYDTLHVGGIIPFSNGGPGDGAFQRAVQALQTHLYQE